MDDLKFILSLKIVDDHSYNCIAICESNPVKENHIGSVVSEILCYRQKKLTTLYNGIDIIHYKYNKLE